ncbi:MAG: mechanosensitive ion channel [Promethearchaeota archaeon]|nr:MAG: mechanosensitive ion channel [Candidatus Lokiarchaeota archaeon]
MASDVANVFIFIGLTFTFLIIVRILVYVVNHSMRLQRLSANVLNGLRVGIRILGFIAIILLLFTLFEVPSSALISISSVGGIFIGFASSEVMAQIVSGLYLISARPFGIHDFVKIDDVSGMVMEINLSHTIIQQIDGNIVKIPNKTILDSKIKNYTIKVPSEIEKRQIHLKRSEKVKLKHINPEGARKGKIDWNKLRLILDDLTEFAFEEEITRFVFDFEVDLDIPPEVVKEKIEDVCSNYEPVFEHKPQYKLIDLSARATFEIVIYCFSPFIIIHNYDSFLLDISNALYSKEEVDK